MEMMFSAFPDLRLEVEQTLASGDFVVARVRLTGTHKGNFAGVAPTNKKRELERLYGGRIAQRQGDPKPNLRGQCIIASATRGHIAATASRRGIEPPGPSDVDAGV